MDVSKQDTLDALAGLYGLFVLIRNRDDIGDEMRDALDANHRMVKARDVLKASGMLKAETN